MFHLLHKIYSKIKFLKDGYPISPNKILKLMNESQYWPTEKINDYQLTKLNFILAQSKENSKFYKERLKDLNLPLKSIEDYRELVPILTRDTITSNLERIECGQDLNKVKISTSGSSGVPLNIYTTKLNIAYRIASSIRFKQWWNIKTSDKSVLIWRINKETSKGLSSRFKKYFRRRIDIHVNDLNNGTIVNFFNQIEKFKPAYIRGYKSGVLEFAELMKKHNLSFQKCQLKVVIVTSEILYDDERKYIQDALKCTVANEYGAAELNLLGYECPNGSMHVNEECTYLYADKENKVYVTDFFNTTMPLINYKNKDRVVLSNEKCECGRTSRIINEVIGRESGFIIRPDGSKIHQIFFSHIFKNLGKHGFENSIIKFKVVQKGNNFEIDIVPDKNFNPKVEDFIKDKMYSEIGQNIEINFFLKEKIEREKSGKLRYFLREE